MKPEIMGINRLRMGTDGKGISTLVAFYGCHLHCKYCLNPQCNYEKTHRTYITPRHLVNILSVDDMYFKATGGGVVFGGGEPLLQSDYLKEVCSMMPKEWKKRIETSLNVPWEAIDQLIPFIDQWIVDIKESHQDLYREYTGADGMRVYDNVVRLSELAGKEKVIIRIPEIPEFNTEDNVITSMEIYSGLGELDVFRYRKLGASRE